MQADSELAGYVAQMYEQFSTGSPDGVEGMLTSSPGLIGIGTDPAEWWVDEAVGRAFRAQIPEMHGAGLRFQGGEVKAYSEGSVGWVADQPSLRMPDGSEIPMRYTGVWHREGGAWKMVQFHLSMGVSNEDALGEELTV